MPPFKLVLAAGTKSTRAGGVMEVLSVVSRCLGWDLSLILDPPESRRSELPNKYLFALNHLVELKDMLHLIWCFAAVTKSTRMHQFLLSCCILYFKMVQLPNT
jgi:hypothetical protein